MQTKLLEISRHTDHRGYFAKKPITTVDTLHLELMLNLFKIILS